MKQRDSNQEKKKSLQRVSSGAQPPKTDDTQRTQQPERRPPFQKDLGSRGGWDIAFPAGVSHGESLKGRQGGGFKFPQTQRTSIGLAMWKENWKKKNKENGCSEGLASSSKVTEQQGQRPSLGGSATRASTACLLCAAQTTEGDLCKIPQN